jgi:2-succinyl-6-hydroxy-2,4-cyclohexadiene-1-carboxylate synthase
MPPPPAPAALHVEVTGDGPPLVLAHGFTQTGRLWGGFAERLGRRRLVRVDLPGHAGSDEVRADLDRSGALLLAAGLAAADGDQVDLLGYSLGARVALHAALGAPDRVRRLVLVGATGGIEDRGAREERRRRDEALADELERTGDLEGFLRRWVANPMLATLRAPDLGERRRNTATGLASSLRLAGTGTQRPLWDELGTLGVPVLVVAGAADLRFCATGGRLADTVADGLLSLVPGAGHAAHLEQPVLTGRLVAGFLADG